jgi:hypothetical protein
MDSVARNVFETRCPGLRRTREPAATIRSTFGAATTFLRSFGARGTSHPITPVSTRAQGIIPALCSVDRDAGLEGEHRAAGIRPIS